MENTLYARLAAELKGSVKNWYGEDNWDYLFRGPYYDAYEKGGIVRRFFRKKFFKDINLRRKINRKAIIKSLKLDEDYFSRYEQAFERLANEDSKVTLIKVLAFHIAGYRRVKLPLNNGEFWENAKIVENIKFKALDGYEGSKVPKEYDLRELSLDCSIISKDNMLMQLIINKQYEYNVNGVEIKAEQGDVVVDAGGFWGDTAVYFAHEVGDNGKVFVFEFVPNNINVFNKCVAANPGLSKNIELIQHPLWSSSGKKVYIEDKGGGSTVHFEKFNDKSLSVETRTIDEMVENGTIEKVDFIKMDIEGAEYDVLQGAAKTIKQFKPKLALSVYHKSTDFVDFVEFLDGLDLGYKYYVDHSSIHTLETMFFAEI